MNLLELLVEKKSTGYIGFPEYEQKMFEAPYIVEIQLETEDDVKAFVDLVGFETLLNGGVRSAKSFWYPELERGERGSNANYIWVDA